MSTSRARCIQPSKAWARPRFCGAARAGSSFSAVPGRRWGRRGAVLAHGAGGFGARAAWAGRPDDAYMCAAAVTTGIAPPALLLRRAYRAPARRAPAWARAGRPPRGKQGACLAFFSVSVGLLKSLIMCNCIVLFVGTAQEHSMVKPPLTCNAIKDDFMSFILLDGHASCSQMCPTSQRSCLWAM